jgi:hypothetical protein
MATTKPLFARLLLAGSILWIAGCGKDGIGQIPFEPAGWKSADPLHERPRTVRSRMIRDLLGRYEFTGWSRQQIVAVLGEPTAKWSGFEHWDMIYVLGLERASVLSLDDEALGFKFGADGKVKMYGLSVN